MRLVDFYQSQTIPAHLGCSRLILEKSFSWGVSMSTIWLVSFAPQASLEWIYTSSESPCFSLSNDIFKCNYLFLFHFFLWATMFIVEISYCIPPGKLDLLRSVNNVKVGQIIPHSIVRWKKASDDFHVSRQSHSDYLSGIGPKWNCFDQVLLISK